LNICLITSFNYGKYLDQAITSALKQELPFDRLIIVDDGSTDDSSTIIDKYVDRPNVFVVRKSNGGQLSALNAAAAHVARESRVFFLDADDVYPFDYLKCVVNALSSSGSSSEFVFCEEHRFSQESALLTSSKTAKNLCVQTIPCTSALVRKFGVWIGNVTSSLSISGELFLKILPCPLERDWMSRADDVLVFGASIAGVEKTYLEGLFVNYRVHGANAFCGRELSAAELLIRQAVLERLFKWLCARFQLPDKPLAYHVSMEYKFFPSHLVKHFGLPIRRKKSLGFKFMRWLGI